MKVDYERIVDRNSLSLQSPAILFQNERLPNVPHPDSSSLQICSRQLSQHGLKKKLPYPCTRCSVTAITHFPSHVHSQTSHLLHNHLLERTVRQQTQTPNVIFSHYNSLLVCNDLLPCVNGNAQPGLNPLYIGPCENSIIEQAT